MNDNTNLLNLTILGLPLELISLLIGSVLGMIVAGTIFFWWSRQFKLIKRENAILEDRQQYQSSAFDRLEEEKRILGEKFQASQQELVRAQTEKSAIQNQVTLRKEDEKLFEAQFENLAHKIFDEKNEKFKHQSQENLTHILKPLKQDLENFNKKVDNSFNKQAKEQFSLTEQIKSIVEANDKITLQAENLTNALKGDSKTQGDWGEIMLEKILEASGLRKGDDYITQGSGMGIKHVETGRTLKPDVIVNLPEEKHVIIDSKVSLTHYERWHAEVDDIERGIHLKQFLSSIRQHVKDLEKRDYQSSDQLGAPDFVLMFIPIESAYMLALQEDKEMHSFAWNKGVAIVCPTTLQTSLKTISSLWRLVLQNQNAIDIANKGGALYDKIAGFVGDMQVIGNNLKTIDGNYTKAMNKLSDGRGSILKRTEDLKELGAKASKSLPSDLVRTEIEKPSETIKKIA